MENISAEMNLIVALLLLCQPLFEVVDSRLRYDNALGSGNRGATPLGALQCTQLSFLC